MSKIAKGIEWRNRDSVRKEVDLLVRVEKERIVILRLSFRDFTWELVNVKLRGN